MKVLIIATDVFENVGGGETVYKKIISSAPEIDFYYFVTDMHSASERPKHAHPILLQSIRKLKVLMPPPFPAYKLEALMEADRYAYSVKEMTFDIVDIPDYYSFGSYLCAAFQYNNVNVKKIVLAMHGNLSTSINLAWDKHDTEHLRVREEEQFATADFVYAISQLYIEEWQSKIQRSVYYINPLNFVAYKRGEKHFNKDEKVNVFCIGRTERRKGNDIFVDIMRWIDPQLFGECAHIGNETYLDNGVPSSYHLKQLALHRDMNNIGYYKAKSREELNEVYNSKSLVIIPTRYDTLNLVALEALLSGCPVAVSEKAGVCKFLDNNYPELPYIKIRFDHLAEAIAEIEDVLKNYECYRELLNQKLLECDFAVNPCEEITQMYRAALNEDGGKLGIEIQYTVYKNNLKYYMVMAGNKLHLLPLYRKVKKIRNVKGWIKGKFLKILKINDARFIKCVYSVESILQRYRNVSNMAEASKQQISEKLNEVYNLASESLFRINAYAEIARLQDKRKNSLVSKTFLWRKLKLLGESVEGEVKALRDELIRHKFEYVVETVDLLYDNDEMDNVYQFLKDEQKRLLVNQQKDNPFVTYEDCREGNVKVSIIVSLYNASNKLDYFISMISKQTLFQTHELEIIFVDSCSPKDEKKIIDKYKSKLNYLYVRTKDRETIQAAWNRGISLARGAYITFLGVDEMMYPEAISILLSELEKDETVDWVVGDSIIQQVDMDGVFDHEEMMYRREGLNKALVYLETCYLTYVGGLYRKSVHERFGYYDASYRGAGDTEFKNRVLPFIQVKHIKRTLGIFLNYPEERVTASPMAEIEDMKAYYLFKSLGGVKYVYEKASDEELKQAIMLALSYRKSYTQHISTDLEYAVNLAQYYVSRNQEEVGDDEIADLLPLLKALLDIYRRFEYLRVPKTRFTVLKDLIRDYRDMKKIYTKVQSIVDDCTQIDFSIFNDNRWEQHVHLWR